MDTPDAKYKAEPLPALQLSQDYRSQPLFFKTAPSVSVSVLESTRRRHSTSRSLDRTATRCATPELAEARAPSRTRSSATRSSRASSRATHEVPPPRTYRPTRASVLRQKKTIENEIEALVQSELALQRERDGAENFTRPVSSQAGCPPARTTRASTLRQAHAHRLSAQQDTVDLSTPRTPRVRSASLRSRQGETDAVLVRATRAAELRRALNTQRLHELELARAKLEDEEALIEQGHGEALRERHRRASRAGTADITTTTTMTALDAVPVVKTTKAAALLRERVEAKMKELERLEALEAAAQEALLHPPSHAGGADGRGHPLSPRCTKSSLLRGRSAAAHMLATAADPVDTTTSARRRASRTRSAARSKPSATAVAVDEAGSQLPPPAGAFNPIASAASASGFVVHRPSEPALSRLSETDDPAALLPSAILQIDHVVSDCEEKEEVEVTSEAAAAALDAIVVSPFDEPPHVDDERAALAQSLGADAQPSDDEQEVEAAGPDASPSPHSTTTTTEASQAPEDNQEDAVASRSVSLVVEPVEEAVNVSDGIQGDAHVPLVESSASSSATDTSDVRESAEALEKQEQEKGGEEEDGSEDEPQDTESSEASRELDMSDVLPGAPAPEEAMEASDRSVLSAHDSFHAEEVPGPPTDAVRPAATLPARTATAADAPPPPVAAVKDGPSPSPTEPSLAPSGPTGPLPASCRTSTDIARTRSSSSAQAHQAEALDKLRQARTAKGPAQAAVQPFSHGSGDGRREPRRPDAAPSNVNDTEALAVVQHCRRRSSSTSSRSSSVESIPTFVGVSAVASMPSAATADMASPASFQWSRRPTPPTQVIVPTTAASASATPTLTERSRTAVSWVDFSAVSASPVTGSPSPLSIRQLRLHNTRILHRRYFTKWMALKAQRATPVAALGATPSPLPPLPPAPAQSVPRQERSQTAPPPTTHREDGLRVPQMNRPARADVAPPLPEPVMATAAPPSSWTPAPAAPADEARPSEPDRGDSLPLSHRTPQTRAVRPSGLTPSPQSRPSLPVAPAAAASPSRRADESPMSRYSLGQSSLPPPPRSPFRGLRVPRLQESFSSLPRGVAGDVGSGITTTGSVAPHRGPANDSWQALESSPTSALSSAALQVTLPSAASSVPVYPLPSPIRRLDQLGVTPPPAPKPFVPFPEDWPAAQTDGLNRADGHAPVVLARMPPIAPQAWAVTPPAPVPAAPLPVSSSPPASAVRAVERAAPPAARPAKVVAVPPWLTQRRSTTPADDSLRELAERTPCDTTLDTFLLLQQDGDGSVEGTPSSALDPGGVPELSRHAPTPLLSTLQPSPPPPSLPPVEAETVAETAPCPSKPVPAAARLFRRQDSSSSYSAVQRPLVEEDEDEDADDERREEPDAVEAEDDLASRYLRDGSRGFSSSSAVSGGGGGVLDDPHSAATETTETAVGRQPEVVVPPIVTTTDDVSWARPQDEVSASSSPSALATEEDAAKPGREGLPPLATSASPLADLYRPASPIPSTVGSVGRAETYYMSASNPSPHEDRWGAGSPEDGSPNPLSLADPELQQDLDDLYPEALVEYIKYVHRDM